MLASLNRRMPIATVLLNSRCLSVTAASKESINLSIHQTIAGRARFYREVAVVEIAAFQKQRLYGITLDGRPLKTPGRNPLHLPNLNLTMAIAAEWDAQTNVKKGITPATMPLMTIVSTAIDQVAMDRNHTIQTCMSYLPTDSALFYTHDLDRLLLKKQRQHFQPVIRSLKKNYGLELQTKHDMYGRIEHPEETRKKVEWMLKQLDHLMLACLQSVTMECKSLVLAISYLSRFVSLNEIKAASRLEEEFQLEIWGVVEGGHDMDRLNNEVSLSAAGIFFGLYQDAAQHKQLLQRWQSDDWRVDLPQSLH